MFGYDFLLPGHRPSSSHVAAILDRPLPTTQAALRREYGRILFFKRHVQNFTKRTSHVVELLKACHKSRKPFLTEEAKTQLLDMRQALTQPPILCPFRDDKDIVLITDASAEGLGWAVTQEQDDGHLGVVSYGSQALIGAERKQPANILELLCVTHACQKERHRFWRRQITVHCDHRGLENFSGYVSESPRVNRLLSLLGDFDLRIVYTKPAKTVLADQLSRDPLPLPAGSPGVMEALDCLTTTTNDQPLLERLLAAQRSDPDLARLIRYMESGEAPDCDRRTINKVTAQAGEHVLVDGGLYYKGGRRQAAARIPVDLMPAVLAYCHDERGHPGMKESLAFARDRFYSPSLRHQVEQYVRDCLACALTKTPHDLPHGLLRPRRPQGPFTQWSVDIMGPYPASGPGRQQYALILTDTWTRWVELFALSETTTERIAATIHNEVFLRFGFPQEILTDNAPYFRRSWDEIVRARWQAQPVKSAVYTARQNSVERRCKDVKTALRLGLLDQPHKHWATLLPRIRFHLLSRTCASTGFSPAELVLGAPLSSPGDHAFPDFSGAEHADLAGWQAHHSAHVAQMRSAASSAMAIAMRKYTDASNARRVPGPRYAVGDLVLVRNRVQSSAPHGITEGLCARWRGPLRIDGQVSPDVYSFHEPGSPVPRYNLPAEDMRPCPPGAAHGPGE